MTVRGRVDGMLGRFVSGWALPAHGRHCAIMVKDAQGGPVVRGMASQERADLADLGLGRSDFAFCLELPGCEQRRAFHVLADGEELAGSPLLAGPGQYDGDCMMDRGVLKGWVRERTPALSTPCISVVTQHGEVVGEGLSAIALADFPNCAGFGIELSNAVFGAGELRLRVLADGTPFTECACELPLQGSIDLITPQSCAGWLLAPDAPHRLLEIEFFRNGEPVAIAPCSMPRADVRELFPEKADAGFAASFPLDEARQMRPVRLSLRLRGSSIELFGGPHIVANREAAVIAAQHAARVTLAALGPAEKTLARAAFQQFLHAARSGQVFSAALPVVKTATGKPRISIIIPVYGDIAATQTCIDSVLRHRCAATDRVILINDASPEPGMAEMLNAYAAQPNLFTLTNPENRGFIHSVNRGFAFAGLGDILLLNADTVVFPGVFDELCAIARAAPEIGTVTALSNDATIFSYPYSDPETLPGDLADCSWGEVAAAALERNAGRYVEVPTGHGFCMLIREETLQAVGHFDPAFGRGYGEENDFCQRASDLGYAHVAAAGVFVRHRGSLSFGGEKEPLLHVNSALLSGKYPEYFPRVREFSRRDGLRTARWALDAWRLERARRHGAEFVLIISNSLVGGTAKAIADIERLADDGAIRLRLNCREDGGAVLAGQNPLFRAGFAEDEMPALFELLDAAAPNRVLAHQFLGFSTAFLQRLGQWLHGRASTFHLHDFYPLCPRVTLIDAAGDYCGLAEPETCARCIAVGGAHANSRIAGLAPAAYRALFGNLLSGFGEVIAPSQSAAAIVRRGLPRLALRVVPHPETDIPPPGQAARRLQSLEPPVRAAADAQEIVLFGALGPHKGSGKLLEIAKRARLTHPALLFRVIGYTNIDEELLPLGNVIITGRYEPQMLAALAEEARGCFALFLHEWPETWSYTLSEALSHGFVPLVPDIGAPAERVRALGYGVVYPFPASAAEILQVIETVLASGGAGVFAKTPVQPATAGSGARRRAGE